MELGLNGKTAFVAGSSRGIGLAIARAFLREGARVAISGRNPNALAQAQCVLEAEASQDRFLPIRGDMTDSEQINQALTQTVDLFGSIDAVVGNVGSGAGRIGWDLSVDDWGSLLKVNLLGSMYLATAAFPHLLRRGGSLTFISSIAGIEAIGAPIPYSAAKAAVQTAVKSFSRLVGSEGVRVNAVAPGNVLFPGGTWERKLKERQEFLEQYIQTEVALQRFGSPEEIADAVIFLASERASFVTGACLVVDGGQTRSMAG